VFLFLKGKSSSLAISLKTDIHSHLLAQLDDGVKSTEEAIALILRFKSLGYSKIITTPHISSDYYRNDPSAIQEKLNDLRKILSEKGIDFHIEAAAEYLLDEELSRKIDNQDTLLTFGNSYLLFETNFLSEPLNLKEFTFKAISSGYKLVLAHPERYQYMNLEKARDLRDRGLLFQINIPSLVGYYSKPIQKMAYQLIDKGWIDFLGSDCHNTIHIDLMKEAVKNKYYQKALMLPLLNNTL
jgi:protein-tyrosine phosphatase